MVIQRSLYDIDHLVKFCHSRNPRLRSYTNFFWQMSLKSFELFFALNNCMTLAYIVVACQNTERERKKRKKLE